MLSRLVIAFLVRRKHLLISWLQSPSAVILEPKRRKSITASTFSPSVCHEVMGPDAIILVFWMLSFKPAFILLFHPSSRGSLVSLHFSAIRVVSSPYLRLLIFLPAILIPACDSSSLAFHMMYSVYRTFLVATYFPHNLVSTALWIIFKHKFHSVLPLLNSPLAFFMTMLWALFTKGSEKFRMCSRSYRL